MEAGLALDTQVLLAEIGWIRSLALQLVRDAAAADDLVQQTLLAALRQRPSLERGLRPWLGAVVRRQAALGRRSAAHRHAREKRSARTEALPSAHDLAARAELQRALVDAVLSLTEPYRSVILLCYFEGLTPREIAHRRGLSGATVRSQLKRGLDELRATLDRRHRGESRTWAVALMPLAIEKVSLHGAAASTMTAILALFTMSTWFKLAVSAALLVALLALVLPDSRQARFGGASPPADEVVARKLAHAAPLAARTDTLERLEATRAVAESTAPTTTNEPPPYLRARIVARHSEEPLADVRLQISGPSAFESVVTDSDGAFECPRITQAGRYWATPASADGFGGTLWLGNRIHSFPNLPPMLQIDWKPGDDAVLLRLTFGPTYRLSFAVPAGLATSDFEARLEAAPSFPPPPGVLSVATGTRVVDDGGPLARFAFGRFSTAWFEHEPKQWRLRLTSSDGLWAGVAAVPRCFGPCSDVVSIDLEPATRLELELKARDGSAITLPELEYVRDGDGESHGFGSGEFASGVLVLRGLERGTYRFSARTAACEPAELELVLDGSAALHQVVILQPVPHKATIQGELHSRTGQFQDGLRILLSSDDRGKSRNIPAEWSERGGGWVAAFRFDDLVADAEYRLSVIPTPTPPSFSLAQRRWSPRPGAVRAPARDLVFVVEDDEPLDEVCVRVRDGRTGQPVDKASVELFAEGEWVHCRPRAVPSEHHAQVWPGAALAWRVSAEGYVPAFGTERDLLATPQGSVVEVALTPGWGMRVVVRSSADARPLPGVEIVLDGIGAGRTGSDGSIDLRADEKPELLGTRHPGWRLVDGRGEPVEAGLHVGPWPMTLLTLEREP